MTVAYSEFDDILGPAPGSARKNASKRKQQAPEPPAQDHRQARREAALDRLLNRKTSAEDMKSGMDEEGGVTVFWLAKTFGLDVSTVRKRIADCPVLRRKSSGFTYQIGVAAKYLVDPVMSVEDYIKGLKPGELPESIRASYWDAQLKRQKWELNAKQLWHTVDVLNVLGETFVTMKATMDLWAETLERNSGLTDDQRKKLEAMVDCLQDELQDALVTMAKKRSTPSSAVEQAGEDDYDGLL